MPIAELDALIRDGASDLDLVLRLDLEAVYVDARNRLLDFLVLLDDEHLAAPVRTCPGWTVKDVVAHLVALAAGLYTSTYPDPDNLAWRDPALATARDVWNAANLARRRGWSIGELLAEWEALDSGVLAFHRPGGLPAGKQSWMQYGYVVDLAAHLHDVRHAVGTPGDRNTFSTWACFAIYRVALDMRLRDAGLPAVALRSGERSWTSGDRPAAAVLTASPFELYRTIGGRRTWQQIRGLEWQGDPEPYRDLIALYSLPVQACEE